MTDTFTASNGEQIEHRTASGALVLIPKGRPSEPTVLSHRSATALREFFRAEEDTRLGRWRWPENPRFVVYPIPSPPAEPGQDVHVISETTGVEGLFSRTRYNQGINDMSPGSLWPAAAAYFAAHPVEPPKPWHNAKEGDVWLIEHNGNEYPAIFQADRFRDHGGSWDADSITSARRIWPEES